MSIVRFSTSVVLLLLFGLATCHASGQELLPLPPIGSAPLAQPIIQGEVVEDPSVGLDVPCDLAVAPAIGNSGQPWYNPLGWFSPTVWDGSFELGINGYEGNVNTLSLRTGFELSRETENTNWDIDFTYGKTEANGVETQNNALLQSKWDYRLANPRWTWFSQLGLIYDEFRDFDLRLNLNTGLGYLFIDNDNTQLRGRLGSGTSREFGGIDEEWKPEAVFGIDLAHQLTSRQKLSIVSDYFPTWDDFSDYRVITDASWEVVLDEASNLSLKLGVIDRYDSTPNGAQRNAVDYSLLLLFKL